jgi:hypothetical protein
MLGMCTLNAHGGVRERYLCCHCVLQVLLGPFVDVEQPLISGGMINVTFQQLFQTQVGTF